MESKHMTLRSQHYTKNTVRKELPNSHKMIMKMAELSLNLSIITLNVNGLNSPVKRYRTQYI
jgi:hypothetical protein